MLNDKEVGFYIEKYVEKINTTMFLCIAGVIIKSIQVYAFIEDNIVNTIKNANALENIKVGEIWREYEDDYTGLSYSDWIILSKNNKKVTVSNIKSHLDFAVKSIEPRIICEFWTKK